MQCKNPKWLCYMTENYQKINSGNSTIRVYTTDKMIKNRIWIQSKVIIPCGMCMACRINYTEQWTNRIISEGQEHTNNFFITLTYDEEHLPENRIADLNTGEIKVDYNGKEIIPHPLIKKDLQDFNKRLRIYYQRNHMWEGIRHFGVGEYGSETGRPHYHEILFNFPIYDGKEIGTTTKYRRGHKFQYKEYHSDTLEKIWGKGMVRYGELNEMTARYVAGYAVKKMKGKNAAAYYEERGLTPEFCISSRRPGIGMNTFDAKREEILLADHMVIKDSFGGKIIPVPKAYHAAAIRHTAEYNGKIIKSRYTEEEIDLYRKICKSHKPKHEAAAEAIENQMLYGPSSLSLEAQMRVQVESAESRITTMKGCF